MGYPEKDLRFRQMSRILSIIIPTYNRPEALKHTVSRLIPQLTAEVMLVIIDNCSDESVELMLSSEVATGAPIRIIRNSVNVGLSANICRCFEHCQTPWFWLLGDDDKPGLDAVGQILEVIKKASPKTIYFNFSSSIYRHSTDYAPRSIADFWLYMNRGKRAGNLLFISSGIYRLEPFRSEHRFGSGFATTGAPHLALLIRVLRQEYSAEIKAASLVEWESSEPTERWSELLISLGLPLLREVPGVTAEANRAMKTLTSFTGPGWKRGFRLLLWSDVPAWYLANYFARMAMGGGGLPVLRFWILCSGALFLNIFPSIRQLLAWILRRLGLRTAPFSITQGLSRT
jgi:glycosyltransferase involved in cell wall biosynthesis